MIELKENERIIGVWGISDDEEIAKIINTDTNDIRMVVVPWGSLNDMA